MTIFGIRYRWWTFAATVAGNAALYFGLSFLGCSLLVLCMVCAAQDGRLDEREGYPRRTKGTAK